MRDRSFWVTAGTRWWVIPASYHGREPALLAQGQKGSELSTGTHDQYISSQKPSSPVALLHSHMQWGCLLVCPGGGAAPSSPPGTQEAVNDCCQMQAQAICCHHPLTRTEHPTKLWATSTADTQSNHYLSDPKLLKERAQGWAPKPHLRPVVGARTKQEGASNLRERRRMAGTQACALGESPSKVCKVSGAGTIAAKRLPAQALLCAED